MPCQELLSTLAIIVIDCCCQRLINFESWFSCAALKHRVCRSPVVHFLDISYNYVGTCIWTHRYDGDTVDHKLTSNITTEFLATAIGSVSMKWNMPSAPVLNSIASPGAELQPLALVWLVLLPPGYHSHWVEIDVSKLSDSCDGRGSLAGPR